VGRLEPADASKKKRGKTFDGNLQVRGAEGMRNSTKKKKKNKKHTPTPHTGGLFRVQAKKKELPGKVTEPFSLNKDARGDTEIKIIARYHNWIKRVREGKKGPRHKPRYDLRRDNGSSKCLWRQPVRRRENRGGLEENEMEVNIKFHAGCRQINWNGGGYDCSEMTVVMVQPLENIALYIWETCEEGEQKKRPA